jgi:hypothetical protein
MSLSQFLAVSDAVEHQSEAPSPYRVIHERVVPAFPPARSPAPAARDVRRPAKPAGRYGQLTLFKGLSPEVPMAPVVAPEPAAPVAPPPARAVPLEIEPAALPGLGAGSGAAENRRRSPVRPEATFEGVRVLRNDLAGADLEVRAPAQSRSRSGRMWDALSARLFSLGLGWFKS